MIRAGQMAFAEIIKTFLKSSSRKELLRICELFSDCREDAPFSIQAVAELGMSRFKVRPGEWYNLNQIAFILSDLLARSQPKELRALCSLVFNSSTLFFDQIVKAFEPQPVKACSHAAKDQLICPECFISQKQVSIIVLSRLGLRSTEPQYL